MESNDQLLQTASEAATLAVCLLLFALGAAYICVFATRKARAGLRDEVDAAVTAADKSRIALDGALDYIHRTRPRPDGESLPEPEP